MSTTVLDAFYHKVSACSSVSLYKRATCQLNSCLQQSRTSVFSEETKRRDETQISEHDVG
jgi:hypothetical protein